MTPILYHEIICVEEDIVYFRISAVIRLDLENYNRKKFEQNCIETHTYTVKIEIIIEIMIKTRLSYPLPKDIPPHCFIDPF